MKCSACDGCGEVLCRILGSSPSEDLYYMEKCPNCSGNGQVIK